MDTDEDDLRDLKIVYSILKSGTGTQISFVIPEYCEMATLFKIDGSRLARDNFADVITTTLIPTAN